MVLGGLKTWSNETKNPLATQVILLSFSIISNCHLNTSHFLLVWLPLRGFSLGKHLHILFLGDYMNPNLRVCVDRTEDPWTTYNISKCSVKRILGRWELEPRTWKKTALEVLRRGLLLFPCLHLESPKNRDWPATLPPSLQGRGCGLAVLPPAVITNTLTASSSSCQRDLRAWSRWGLGSPHPLAGKKS